MSLPNFVSCKNTIEYIISKIQNKEFGIYLRYGDGDFNLANGQGDMMANPTPKLQILMLNSMKIEDNSVLFCIPHHNKELNTLEEGMYPGNHECSLESVVNNLNFLYNIRGNIPSNIFSSVALSYSSSHHEELVIKIHKEIQKYPVLFIGNFQYTSDFLKNLFGDNIDIVPTNSRDSFLQFDEIFNKLDNLYTKYENLDYYIIIMAAGCAGRGFSGEIYRRYKNRNYFIFDYGSLLDFLNNNVTRAYMDFDPPKRDYILSNI